MTKVSPLRNKKRGAEDERDVGRILGATRHPADTGGKEDLEHPTLCIQVKGGLRVVTDTIREGLDAATAACPPGKLPVLVVVDRAGTRLRRFVVMDLGVFADWNGFGPKEES